MLFYLSILSVQPRQKAKEMDLDSHEIEYTERHIVEENPTYEEELKNGIRRAVCRLFFNTSGMIYKEMKLKDKLPDE